MATSSIRPPSRPTARRRSSTRGAARRSSARPPPPRRSIDSDGGMERGYRADISLVTRGGMSGGEFARSAIFARIPTTSWTTWGPGTRIAVRAAHYFMDSVTFTRMADLAECFRHGWEVAVLNLTTRGHEGDMGVKDVVIRYFVHFSLVILGLFRQSAADGAARGSTATSSRQSRGKHGYQRPEVLHQECAHDGEVRGHGRQPLPGVEAGAGDIQRYVDYLIDIKEQDKEKIAGPHEPRPHVRDDPRELLLHKASRQDQGEEVR